MLSAAEMINHLASSGANWSGSTLFAKDGYIRVQQDKGPELLCCTTNVLKFWTLIPYFFLPKCF